VQPSRFTDGRKTPIEDDRTGAPGVVRHCLRLHWFRYRACIVTAEKFCEPRIHARERAAGNCGGRVARGGVSRHRIAGRYVTVETYFVTVEWGAV
jgi:hypothetical protein